MHQNRNDIIPIIINHINNLYIKKKCYLLNIINCAVGKILI